MNQEQFESLMDEWTKARQSVMRAKGQEYSKDEDKLHNFRRAAALVAKGSSMEAAAWNFALKHFISILDMIEGMEAGKRYPMEVWKEKLGDAANYLDLIYAIVSTR